MIKNLAERVNANDAVVRRGRCVSLTFVWAIGADDYLVKIRDGLIVGVEKRTLATETGRFSIRAAADVWEEFWQPMPKRDHHDLFSMLSAGLARVDGDLLPLMQNLRYFKDVLASLRKHN
jgi:hypothetical protein